MCTHDVVDAGLHDRGCRRAMECRLATALISSESVMSPVTRLGACPSLDAQINPAGRPVPVTAFFQKLRYSRFEHCSFKPIQDPKEPIFVSPYRRLSIA